MPLFEFFCGECGETFEDLQKRDDPPPDCPKCKEQMQKMVSQGSSFRLVGPRWAKDGYK